MNKNVQTVIFDWAGTVIDYGCFAPIHAFLQAFKEKGVEITLAEARKPMGMRKRDHIEEILKMERVKAVWLETFQREASEVDVDELYESFERSLFADLHKFTDPIPDVLDVVENLRARNIKIGSTTGYTKEMMDVVKKHAAEKGYTPDSLVTADQVTKARPYPFMIYKNLLALEAFPPTQVVKVGDTVSDIKEGKNAGAWSVGIIKGSSELGLTEAEVNALTDEEYKQLAAVVAQTFRTAGADFVIDSIADLPATIEKIDEMLLEDRYDEPVL